MRELRTQENEKFGRFFEIVREEANRLGGIFFVDCGEGNEFFSDSMEGENLSGWLIPKEDADAFETEFTENNVSDRWDDFMKFLRWKKKGDRVSVEFEDF